MQQTHALTIDVPDLVEKRRVASIKRELTAHNNLTGGAYLPARIKNAVKRRHQSISTYNNALGANGRKRSIATPGSIMNGVSAVNTQRMNLNE